MALIFDGDPYTLAKTFESNPFVLELTFPTPRTLRGFSIVIGSATVEISMRFLSTPNVEPIVYTFQGQGSINAPELSFEFPNPTVAEVLHVEVRDLAASSDAMIHIWELKLH